MNITPSIAARHAVTKRPKPPVPVATDIAIHVTAKNGEDVALSYWDVWYALLADDDFDSDLDQLAQELQKMRKSCINSDAAKRKLSHLRDVQQRLVTAGIGLPDIVAAIPSKLKNSESRRAYGRIIKHNQRSYELSEPMRVLPETRLYEAALSGMWVAFPVSPEFYYKKLRAKFNWGRFHGENASRGLAKKLDAETAAAAKLINAGKFAEALATLRGAMTVTLELAEIADDSFGRIGTSFQQMFEDYLVIPREKAGIAPEIFLPDLLELLIFEDYGFTYDHTDGFFASLSREEGDLCLAYLRGRIPALMALDLDYQARNALTLLGQVAAEQKRFEMFETLATEMGAHEWQRIVRLVDAAEKAGRRELAVRVFRNALASAEGFHVDFLTKKNEQLLQGNWSPDPRK